MTEEMFTDEELDLLHSITGREATRFLTESGKVTGSVAVKRVTEESQKRRNLYMKVQRLCLERGRS